MFEKWEMSHNVTRLKNALQARKNKYQGVNPRKRGETALKSAPKCAQTLRTWHE